MGCANGYKRWGQKFHWHQLSKFNCKMSTGLRFALLVAASLVASVASDELEVTCGDGQIIDLPEGEDFYWYSPGWMDGDDYPEDIEYAPS